MYSRAEGSRLRQEFWTTFGKYMSPVPSAAGTKINWVNYHTGVKDIYFRMDADTRSASVSISIEHRDKELRRRFLNQLLMFETLLHDSVNERWTWQADTTINGKTVSRIFTSISGVSVFNRDDWPELISFFKPRIIALDQFWEDAKYHFDELL